MKKLLLIVLALLFSAGTIFSQIALSPNLELSSSIDSRAGFLLYETDNASWFHTERFDAELLINPGQEKKRSAVSVGARHLFAKSDRTDFNAALRFGSVGAAFSNKRFKVRSAFGMFELPGELKILSGEPRFVLDKPNGLFASAGADVNFCLFGKDWRAGADFLFGKANVANGDMYYFYGRPDNFLLFGGRAKLDAPFGISLFAFGGSLSADFATETDVNIGNFGASICALYLAKEFRVPLADKFSVKPFLGYACLRADGTAWLSSANQTYSLFPFRYVGGNFDAALHFLSAGLSFAVKKGGFNFTLDFVYLACVGNIFSGSYAYRFKKNLFFDGSSDEAEIPFPEMAGSHIFAGVMEASYRFNLHKHFAPTVKITKMLAAAILSQETLDFINNASSSDNPSAYSTITEPPEAISGGGLSTAEIIARALLSGTSVSVKIEF